MYQITISLEETVHTAKGGGILVYVKNTISCTQMNLPKNNLECVGVTLSQSPEMSFNLIVLYRPPNEKDSFFNKLKEVLKVCNKKEVLLMGDFNLNWLDKTRRKKLKNVATQFHLTQVIENPTRLTQSSKTLIYLIFASKSDHINKIYNLIAGISDHNLTLVSRKLPKSRYRNQNIHTKKTNSTFIPKKINSALTTI